MSQYIETFYAALTHVTKQSCPQIGMNGVWRTEFLENFPWERTAVPYTCIKIPSMPNTFDWGVNNLVYRPQVEIYYVDQVKGDSAKLIAVIETLRDAFWPTSPGLTYGQVREVPELSWSEELVPNGIFIAKDLPRRCVRVVIDCLVGETWTVV